ncbi:MAG: outer membrane beta-barrel protein [Candidatus Sabulitectum sp.]|nr:outer membrane beta-barrel protein [Candidatus Sabulitectum sp.]
MYKITLYSLTLALLTIPASAHPGNWTGNINAFLGMKYFDSDDWMEEFQEQAEGGILFDIKKNGWPVCLVFESMYSMDEDEVLGVDIEVSTSEVFLGGGKTWAQNSTIRPFVRAGINIIAVEQKNNFGSQSETFDESATGYAVSGGVYWTLDQHFNLGIGIRYSKAEIDFDTFEVEAGGTHSGLVIGYHW